MQPLSVVIICKNESDVIARSLQSLQGLTDDVVVYDNGSTDGTQELVRSFPVRLFEGNWEGFGKTKAKAVALAKYDWILGLDADEAIDEELKQVLLNWVPDNDRTVYSFAYRNFLGERHLRFGEWGRDRHIRLFNRRQVHWDDAPVHENLVMPPGTAVKKLKGHILHRTMRDLQDYRHKMVKYAMLGAQKYFEQGKKASWYKLHLSPGFNFFRHYILEGGFLDGRPGYQSARMTAWYTYLKYAKLKDLWRQNPK